MALADHWALVYRLSTEYSVDPWLTLAVIWRESNGDANAVGDGGCSHGLTQNNRCAGLGMGYSVEQLRDPETGLCIFLNHLVVTPRLGTDGSWVALSQRPADPMAYAIAIDRKVPELRAQFVAPDGAGDIGVGETAGATGLVIGGLLLGIAVLLLWRRR
jgi:hypothetical protein